MLGVTLRSKLLNTLNAAVYFYFFIMRECLKMTKIGQNMLN